MTELISGFTIILAVVAGGLIMRSNHRRRREHEAFLKDLKIRFDSIERWMTVSAGRLDALETTSRAMAAGTAVEISRVAPVEIPVTPPEASEAAPLHPGEEARTLPSPVRPVPSAAGLALESAAAPPVLRVPAPEAGTPARPTVEDALPAGLDASVGQRPGRRGKFEKMFIEHWTGILGAAVVVAGVTFTGIYTALRLAPLYRFLMTLAAAGVLLGISAFLARKEAWRAFSSWLRSAGAAIVLFACAASGGLPGLGLEWIHDPLPALALLLAGIAANLYVAFAGGTQVFATLHVLLGFLPLAIVPPSAMTLSLASAVAIFGVWLGGRGRWDRHLAIVLGAYVLFHALWYVRMGAGIHQDAARLVGAVCAVLVFGAAALLHYRKDYAAKVPSPLQLSVHLVNWGLLALAMIVYVPLPATRAGLLVAFALAAYLLAGRARRLEVPWLHRTDALCAQALVFLALATLPAVGVSATLLLLFAFAETLAFHWLTGRAPDVVLGRVARALPALAGIALGFAGLVESDQQPAMGSLLAAELLVGAVVALLGQRVLGAPGEENTPAEVANPDALPVAGRVLGWLSGMLVLCSLLPLAHRAWMPALALGAISALLMVRHFARRIGLGAGILIALMGAHLLIWVGLLRAIPWTALLLTPRILPLAAVAGVTVWFAGPRKMRQIAIVLLATDLGLAAFLYFDPVSPLIPGVAWLVLSLAALEAANKQRGHDASTLVGTGYVYLAGFLAAYALVIMQSPAYVGAVRARLLIEIFALGVIAYWLVFRPRPALAGQRSWIAVQPLLLEVLLVGAATSVIVEVPPQWWAVTWALFALALLSPPLERGLDARVRAYSILFYWVSVADMAIVLSVMPQPARLWYERPTFTSLIAIGLQVAYTAWSHRRLVLTGLALPRPALLVGRFSERITARRNWFVYYPLFAGVAVFLAWRFDRSLLTVLWTLEAFGIFVLSAWLRENPFRRVAAVGLGACLVRLIGIDMSQANLGLRGAVFIGVGLLMLGMNAIYNRFRTRFET